MQTTKPRSKHVLLIFSQPLPVTKTWLRGLVVGLLLTCRGSFRGVRELLDDHFGCSFSVGTIHNISVVADGIARAGAGTASERG